jgi:hypothetical protein
VDAIAAASRMQGALILGPGDYAATMAMPMGPNVRPLDRGEPERPSWHRAPRAGIQPLVACRATESVFRQRPAGGHQ